MLWRNRQGGTSGGTSLVPLESLATEADWSESQGFRTEFARFLCELGSSSHKSGQKYRLTNVQYLDRIRQTVASCVGGLPWIEVPTFCRSSAWSRSFPRKRWSFRPRVNTSGWR